MEYQKAETAFKKVLELASNYLPAYFNLGLTYYHWKRYNEARDYYLEAQKRGFDNQLIQYHLGLVFSTQGNWNEAYKLWEPILKENPDGPIAIEIKKRIAEPRR